MGIPVVSGASIGCTMGLGSGTLNATSQVTIRFNGATVATKNDVGAQNVGSCGMCTSMGNPTVASATVAALGVLTPQPCIPVAGGTWQASGTTKVGGAFPITNESTLTCSYGGSIFITNPGQTKVQF